MEAKDHLNGVKIRVLDDGVVSPPQESVVESESAWEGFEDKDLSQQAFDDPSTSELGAVSILPRKQTGKGIRIEKSSVKKGAVPRVQKEASSVQGNPFDALNTTGEGDESDGELVWLRIPCAC